MDKNDLVLDDIKMYTTKDIQEIFHIGRNKAYDLCKTSGFPSIKLGNTTLVPKPQLEKWIEENIGCEIIL